MFSKSRAFFFSTAVVFILLLIFFWVSTSLGLTTLEKFAFDLTKTSLFGYKIPQLFGAGLEGNQVEQVNLLKIVFTILILLFCSLLVLVGLRDTFNKQWKLLSSSLGWFILISLIALLYGISVDDHVMIKSEKIELFSVCSLAVISGIFLIFFAKDRPTPAELPRVKTKRSYSKQSESTDGEEFEAENDLAPPPLVEGSLNEDFSAEEKAEAEDPLSAELTVEEDPLAAETPSLKTLAPPEQEEVGDDILKLREELESQEDESNENSSDQAEAEDPLSGELTVEEDPLAAETPSRKTLAPPEQEEVSDDILKLREELESQEDESNENSSIQDNELNPLVEEQGAEEDSLSNEIPNKNILPPLDNDQLSDEVLKMGNEVKSEEEDSQEAQEEKPG